GGRGARGGRGPARRRGRRGRGRALRRPRARVRPGPAALVRVGLPRRPDRQRLLPVLLAGGVRGGRRVRRGAVRRRGVGGEPGAETAAPPGAPAPARGPLPPPPPPPPPLTCT